jgi:hypothetical protein
MIPVLHDDLHVGVARHGKAKPPTPGETGGQSRRPDVKEAHCLRSISFTTRREGSPPFAVDVAHPFHLVLVDLPHRGVGGDRTRLTPFSFRPPSEVRSRSGDLPSCRSLLDKETTRHVEKPPREKINCHPKMAIAFFASGKELNDRKRKKEKGQKSSPTPGQPERPTKKTPRKLSNLQSSQSPQWSPSHNPPPAPPHQPAAPAT